MVKPLFTLIALTASLFVFSQTPGPGGVRTSTNNVFWLRSDKGVTFDGSDNVTTWTDQSNSNNATNAVSLTNPMYDNIAAVGSNSEPAILFTGANNEFLDIADNASINSSSVTARTVFVIFQTGADVSTQQYLYEQGDNTDGLFLYISGGQLSAGINSSSANHTITSAAASIVASTEYIAVLTYDGASGTLDLQLDGTASTTVSSVAASVAAHSGIHIGSRSAGGNHYTGHVAEIIYYDVVLNDGEIRMLNNYLSEKFGITTASDHYTTAGASYRYELTGVSRVGTEEHNTSTGSGGTLVLLENTADPLAANEHVMAGHNNDNLDNTSSDMGLVSGSDRLNRIWFIEKTGNLGVRIEFDLVEAGLSVGVATDYELLRRAGTSGDFSTVTFSGRAINGDNIQFDITDANLASGYFTLAIPATSKRWYALNSGNWDDPNSWTLDPAGVVFNNPENLTPSTSSTSATDEVNIGSGKTITLANDGDIPNPLTKLTVDGTLDFASTTGHGTVAELVGSGTIRLSGDDATIPRVMNLPTITDASNFISAGTGAGTFEIYGNEDIDITAASTVTTFYNLNVNLTSAADDELTIETDITVNGNLNITGGNFQINDNTDAVQRTITVSGNLTVGVSGEISVGTGNPGTPAFDDAHNTYHQLLLQGDFTNNGAVAFSNDTAPDFDTYTTTGAVTVRFQGASDNLVTLANTTQFYNLVVEKGTDQTYVLEINSSDQTYFQIFGRNNGDYTPDPDATPDGNFTSTGKALYLRTGTLKLTGNIFIPSLSEGGNFFGNDGSWSIPSNARLWLDGPNVEVHADASGDGATANTFVDGVYGVTGTNGASAGLGIAQAVFLFGTLKISDGFFDMDDTGYFRYDDEQSPILEIEGGTFNLSAMRNRTFGTSTFSWIQSGGIVNFLGDSEGDGLFTTHDYSLLHLASASTIFQMSGGTINFRGVKKYPFGVQTNPTGINVQSSPENFSVTGGTINIEMNNASSTQLDGSDVDGDDQPASFTIDFTPNFYNLNIIDDDAGSVSFVAGQDVVVSGDLMISSGTTLELNGNNINVGRNFDVAAGSTYTQGGNNTTTFDGSSAQAITLAGTITSDFYDVVLSGTDTKTLASGNMTAANSLTIASGATYNDGGNTIFIENTINNSGTHESAVGGSVEFSGGAGAYTVGGDDNGVFGNVNLNDAANDVSFSASQAITGTLTFSQDQLLDINTNGLTMQGASAAISGASATRYIQTAGNASDGGLSMYVDANETLTFPIGTDAAATPRYTPATATFSNYPTADDGYVTISIGDGELQTLNLTAGSNILTYYWRVNHNGFTTPPRVTYDFVYDNSDIGGNENTYVAGKVLDENPFTRSEDDVTGGDTSVNTGSNTITFNNDNGTPFDVENANYTAGSNGKFTGSLEIYYSRVNNGTWVNWNTASNWSTTGHQGAAASDYPQAGDIAVIGSTYIGGGTGRHQFRSNTTDDITIAELFFDSQSGGTALNVTDMSRLRIRGGRTLTVGKVSGTGEMVQDIGTVAQTATIVGDFGDFIEEKDNGWFYWFQSVQNVTISDRFEFPIFRTFGANGTLDFSQDVTAHGVVIDSDTELSVTTNYTIDSLVQIGSNSGGILEFPNVGANRTFECGYLTYSNDVTNSINVENAGTDIHTLIVNNDITLDQGVDFDLTSAAGAQVILELQGTGTHSFTNSNGLTTTLYQIVMNKGTDQSSTFTFNDDFTVSTPTASLQPIVLQNGTLVLNDAAISVDLTNTTNGNDFDIPSTAGLHVAAGTVNIPSGTNVGITLDGLLQIDGTGILDMDGGDNNYIEYSGSGNATLTVGGSATVSVGSQIRRSASLESGVLKYSQSGTSTVSVGNTAATTPATNRPMFDVRNPGSSFSLTGGTLEIAQDFSTAGTPSLYLDPDGTPTVSPGTLVRFGNANTPTNGNEDMTLYSAIVLDDLEVNTTNGPTVTLSTVGLTLNGDLIIESGTNFDANGLPLTIAGNFNNTPGAAGFTSNSNTTTFNGSTTQVITGNGTTFYNLTKSTSNTLQLAASTGITVSNDLRIELGTLDDNNNDISVSGILHNAATHTNNNVSSTNNGIILAGTNEQDITGAGTYSRIRINNTAGAKTSANISITEQVILNGGVLDIQGNELSMDDDAIFVDGSGGGFSATNMVQTRRSFTDAGIVKTYNGITASPFTYPIGSGDKYTPVVVTLTQNSQTTPTIAVRASDEPHPNVQEDVDVPEFVDQDNVLQYYWEVTSTGMTDFTGDIQFTYEAGDAYVTSPFTLEDYHTARLLPDNSDNWNKLPTGFNYQAADGESTITFNLSTPSADDEIGGDYTAGIEDAVPDQVQTVTSVVAPSGNWTAGGSWNTGSVPTGAIVVVDVGDVITLDANAQVAYRTQIDGELIVGTTINHRLGAVSGSGTLRLETGSLPAGTYDDFFNCSTGGSVDFGGLGSYTLPNEIATIRNLEVSDGGTKSLPNVDVVVCGDLILADGAILNNPQNRSITVLGNLILTNGTLNIGSGVSMTVQGNATVTNGDLNIDNNTLVINGSLDLNGGNLNLGSTGTLDVDTDLTIAGGTLNGANASSINIGDDLTFSSGTVAIDATTTTVTFDGTAASVITGSFIGASSFNNLTINKSAGSLTIVDAGNNDVEVDGTLTLTSGLITTNASNTLTITASGSSAGGSASSYVNGPLTKANMGVGDDFTFHVGASPEYALAGVIDVQTAGQDWTAEFSGSNPNSGQPLDITTNPSYGELTGVTTNGSWTITSSGTNSATVVLGIQTHLDVQDIADVRVAIYDGPTPIEWVNLGGTTTGTISNGTVTSEVAAGFSAKVFTLGGVGASSLPVELIDFYGENEARGVTLHWSTATELNNDYFEVQHSATGENFTVIGQVTGSGTTNEVVEYQFLDNNPARGINYYRLRQVDFDGAFEYSPTIRVDAGNSNEIDFVLYPNPVTNNQFSLQYNAEENELFTVTLVDQVGRVFFDHSFTGANGEIVISPSETLATGLYLLNVNYQGSRKVFRVYFR